MRTLKTLITKIAKRYGYEKFSETKSPISNSIYIHYTQPNRSFATIRLSDHESPNKDDFTIRFDREIGLEEIENIHDFFEWSSNY